MSHGREKRRDTSVRPWPRACLKKASGWPMPAKRRGLAHQVVPGCDLFPAEGPWLPKETHAHARASLGQGREDRGQICCGPACHKNGMGSPGRGKAFAEASNGRGVKISGARGIHEQEIHFAPHP